MRGGGPVAKAVLPSVIHLACNEAMHRPRGHLKHHQPARVVEPYHQIGPLPGGPSVWFQPTPGAAQAKQIYADSQAAEAIGAALLYPHQAPDGELSVIEDCLSQDVTG